MNKTLSAIDKLLAEMPNDGPPVGDEFTIYQYLEAYKRRNGAEISLSGAKKHLDKMISTNQVSVRKGRVNGKQGNIYKPK